MAPKITTIPATRRLHTGASLTAQIIRKVAGYARVSTDHEDQATSYQAQVDFYTRFISSRADWQMVGIYTDEGISGTSTRRRQGFQSMVEDALAGRIDLIITKSVSRFARNTVDTLTTVRALKDKGVEVYFEKENIWTLDAKGELLITIMSSLAQEDSRSISENVTWGHRKRFADGKPIIAYANILGYKRGEGDTMVIDETQAPTVRRIYQLFLDGKSIVEIKHILEAEGHRTSRGNTRWATTTIRSLLRNEKYRGDVLIQKTIVTDFLTKTTKVNEGKSRSATSQGITNRSSTQPPGIRSKSSSPHATAVLAARKPACSLAASNALTVATGTGEKRGRRTLPASTPCGSATTNTKETLSAPRPPSATGKSKPPTLRHSANWLSNSKRRAKCGKQSRSRSRPTSSKPTSHRSKNRPPSWKPPLTN